MTLFSAVGVLLAAFLTAVISGVFGMAGGLILMGALLLLAPVATTMVIHGAVQMVSNGSRALFLRDFISWPLLGRYVVGAAAGYLVVLGIAWRPSERVVFLVLGLLPALAWLPSGRLTLDVRRAGQAEICGFLVQSLNSIAGVAGPLLDLFFVRTTLDRKTVVATKAATQTVAHALKIAIWGPLVLAAGSDTNPSGLALLLLAAAPLSIAGTWLGGQVLERMSDSGFRKWTRWILTGIGVVYLLRAGLG